MVEAGAKVVSEELVVNALEAGHAAIKQIVDMIDRMAKEAGKAKVEVPKKEISRDFYREVEEKVLLPLGEAMQHPGQDRELRGRGPGPRGAGRRDAGRGGRAPERGEGHLQGAQGEGAARRDPRPRRAARRPRVRPGPPDLDRGRCAAARARVGRVHPRRNAGARHRHARHRRRPAEGRDGRAARSTSASCCTTTSRRSRSARWPFLRGPGRREVGHGALAERVAGADAAGRGEVPLHRARRVGHPRVERLLVDGDRCAAGRWR